MGEVSVWRKIVAAIVGLIYVVFGVLMIGSPQTTLASLSLLMGWVVTVSGIIVLLDAMRLRNIPDVGSSYVEGFLLLILGLMFLFGNYINNTLFLAYLLIFWMITDSALQLQVVARFRGGWPKYLTMLIDIIIIIFGVSLLFNPNSAEHFLVLWIGISFIATGFTKVFKVM